MLAFGQASSCRFCCTACCGLALNEELARRAADARCGLQVIDLRSGDVVEWVRFEGMVSELYDVAVLPDVVRPMAHGFKTKEIEQPAQHPAGEIACSRGHRQAVVKAPTRNTASGNNRIDSPAYISLPPRAAAWWRSLTGTGRSPT